MKLNHLKFAAVGALSLIFGRPSGLCTANTLTDDVAAVNQRLSELETQNTALKESHAAQLAALQQQLDAALANKPPVDETLGTLALLAKGAGVDLSDVRWRVQAGVAPEQAVQAAIAQKAFNEEEAKKRRQAPAAK